MSGGGNTFMLLLLLLCVGASEEQQGASSWCDHSHTISLQTTCTSCAAAPSVRCPPGYTPSPPGHTPSPPGHTPSPTALHSTTCRYVVQIGGREVELQGCSHTCTKSVVQSECCSEHWGPLCLRCPTWEGKTCNLHGACLDGKLGNGTCLCDEGFSGFACHECDNLNAYGPSCDKVCECVRGVCSKGPGGSGECLCQPPYSGPLCNQVSDHCRSCPSYSYCGGPGQQPSCVCLPGHRRSSKLNTCMSVCTARDCHPDAECSMVGPKVQCVCKDGYHGDGKICLLVNPCSFNNGGCPSNSTVCIFKGPNKSSCECMLGMAPTGSSPGAGCTLLSVCSLDSCHRTAVCHSGLDGLPRCVCAAGQMGDGRRCYGNLMERLLELDQGGETRGRLSGALRLFGGGCQLALTHEGPYTAFIPRMDTPPTEVQEEVCRNHLMLGQHLLEELEGRDISLQGGATARFKGNKRFILTEDPQTVYTVVQADLPAANGIIHIIDRPIRSPLPGAAPDLKFSDRTIGEILSLDNKYNRFLSLVDNCGATLPLQGEGPLTVFVPTNQAVDSARDGSIMYMITKAKHKLQELLKHHMYSHAALSTGQLASLPQIQTLANQIITITVGNDGKLLLGEQAVCVGSGDIVASNGRIHMVDGLLVPPSIRPILPHRCDDISSTLTLGPCVLCSLLSETQCPNGTTELASHQSQCLYEVSSSLRLSSGCAKNCNSTTQVPQCCSGFFGPDCRPCIGGFRTPCYGRGQCSDGIHGNGSCSCHSGFKGVACHICSDPNKHGEHCDQDCVCVHGVCDNRPSSQGVCRRGSCLEVFSGPLCDQRLSACSSDGLHRHCHAQAYCVLSGGDTTCVCAEGYEGDGVSCSLVNPCLRNRGGCDANAQCVFVSVHNVSCVCNEGWSGDGLLCVEVNSCDLASRGGCSAHATCRYVGPAQSECTCKSGFLGDGVTCERIDPCRQNNGGCHTLAQCSPTEDQVNCTCPPDLHGDGMVCYGSLQEELETIRKLFRFSQLIQKDRSSPDYLSTNLTVFAPTREVWNNFTSKQNSFWTQRHRISHFLRAHMVPGSWSLEDLEGLVGSSLLTLSPPTAWTLSRSQGTLRVGNASILTANLPATNGYIHIINQILAPPLSDLPPDPPTLMAFLNSTSNFTLFRSYALLYNLTEDLKTSDYTLLLPTDDAVRRHLNSTNSTLLDPSVFRYHVLKEALLPADLRDGMLRETLLGYDYQLQFHLKDHQVLVNDAPVAPGSVETQLGVVLVLTKVLTVQKNRCSRLVNLHVTGRCSDCEEPPRCLSSDHTPIWTKFPDKMASNCRFRKRVGSRRKGVLGCKSECLRVSRDHTCCPGFYGHECYRCPGPEGHRCSGHGRCQDGNQGDGACRCYEGFHGTACEDCEPGRYGTNCSSKCAECDHGMCEDGLAGSGRCLCWKGWKGVSCSVEIRDDACGGVCDENANCITGPQGSSPACVCSAGYKGNGTFCKVLDLCSWQNGGCSAAAVCSQVSAAQRTCTCRPGYTGDGVVCLEADGCLLDNGGCHQHAECRRTGPNTTACSCLPGYTGSGRICSSIMFCIRGNCTCSPSAIRHGACKGRTRDEILHNPKNDIFRQMMFRLPRPLPYQLMATIFVPDSLTATELSAWASLGRMQQLVYSHVVPCEVLSLSDLKTSGRILALSGQPLELSLNQGDVYINNRSRITGSDVTSDGVIHYVDQVLTPSSLKNQTSPVMNLTTEMQFYGYTRFSQLIQQAGLLPVLQLSKLQPFLMLWPTDSALQGLSLAWHRRFFSPQHSQELQDILKAHVLQSTTLSLGSDVRSMHGSMIRFDCNKKLVGDLSVNGVRVVERFLTFKGGVAFGIDQLLEPPGLGAHCDGLVNISLPGHCGTCFMPPRCPYKSRDTGTVEVCPVWPTTPIRSWRTSRPRCRRKCVHMSWKPQCCKNHYGPSCQVCPGGLATPCGNHGTCRDGQLGWGSCDCSRGFSGKACERCETGHHGNNCTACECVHGQCDDGLAGSGQCSCESGWYGNLCQKKLAQLPQECLYCHLEAECVPGSGCRCREHFEGNGTFCSPMTVPDLCAEYHGGCHPKADCNQTGWTTNCSCQTGYRGDGFACEPVNRCTEELNGGCSDFATCKFTGPSQRLCECVPGYVGNGVQCVEKVVPPEDRCMEDNGGCHAEASCMDLHYHVGTAGVFHLSAPLGGRYQLNLSQAQSACWEQGATLASFKQLADAQQLGMHLCIVGWLEGGRVGYPITQPSPRCGDGHVGVVLYKEPVSPSSKYDAYCYRQTDVSCVCNSGYVGDGAFCHGAVINVLATNSNYSLFYKSILSYSGSSVRGQDLLDFLSGGGYDVMLFVPHNDGFLINQTLSGRDIEYHVSANHSRRLYQDLQHQEVVRTWLGANLTISHAYNKSDKLVNQRLLVDWDVPAINGIIHVIQAPLQAPPPQVQAQATASLSPAPSSSLSAIFVVLLLALGAGGGGYFLWRRQKTPFNFQYFKNEAEAVPASMLSINNPLYSEHTDSEQTLDLPSPSCRGDSTQ